ncbi:hypothetical protein [Rhizobium grahamii]|uniref:Uncharacterized protein n=1 Tax=Rhizobium grahamii CCGE 502 TaxID=990285 RepID=S3IDB6_9HYPH|nr:hypothetical protein [Rhizobium grahamii]EPE97118.1 hypothetical protein RGCCGE502_16160 [Rhizobium grahamii CCGE 502]
MNRLLEKVITAHGGLRNWDGVGTANATATVTGLFRHEHSSATPSQVNVQTHQNRVTIEPLGCPDCVSHLDHDHLSVVRKDGTIVIGLEDFGLRFEPPIGLATGVLMTCRTLRSMLTSPFLLTDEAVEISELVPWNERGAQWRVLRAEFPPDLSAPARVQDYFFDAEFLLRRHDYHVDGAQAITVCELVADYVDVQGLRMPTKLKGYARRPDLAPDFGRELISVDLSRLAFS